MRHDSDCNHSYHQNANHSFVLLCNDGYMETLGQRIERLRKERNLSQQQVADAAKVSRVAVTKWESGATKNLKLENLLAMCDLFGVPAESLISGSIKGSVAKQEVASYEKPPGQQLNSEEAMIIRSFRKKSRTEQLMVLKMLDVELDDFAQSA